MRLRTSRQDSVPYEDDMPLLLPLAVCAHEDPMSEDSKPVSSFAFQKKPDQYGVYREYSSGPPTITPDSCSPYLALNTSTQSPISTPPLSPRKSDNIEQDWFAPFKNPSTYRLMEWFNNSSATKSMTQLESLVHDVLQAPTSLTTPGLKGQSTYPFRAMEFNNLKMVHPYTWSISTIAISSVLSKQPSLSSSRKDYTHFRLELIGTHLKENHLNEYILRVIWLTIGTMNTTKSTNPEKMAQITILRHLSLLL